MASGVVDSAPAQDWERLWEQKAPEVEGAMRKFAQKCYFPSFDDDDLMQELRIAAFNSLKHWDPEKGSFLNFAWRSFEMMLEKKMRWFDTQKRGGLEAGRTRSELFLSDIINAGHGEGEVETGPCAEQGYVADPYPEQEVVPAWLDGLKSVTPVQKQILEMLLYGYNHKEICAKLELTPNEFAKARKKLEKNLELRSAVCD